MLYLVLLLSASVRVVPYVICDPFRQKNVKMFDPIPTFDFFAPNQNLDNLQNDVQDQVSQDLRARNAYSDIQIIRARGQERMVSNRH